MRDINRAERLLSLFTSPDSAAGIVGDLSEERSERGGFWFWRQVLGTVLSLCRGALFESPVVVLLLVALGLVLSLVASSVTSSVVINLFDLHPPKSVWLLFLIGALIGWPGKLIAGATIVAAAPRIGMVACALLAGLQGTLSLAFAVFVLSHASPVWWLSWITPLATPVLLLLGGAVVRSRWNGRTLRTAQ